MNGSQFTPPPGLEINAHPASLGHPVMCSRPCVYIFRGGFCHHGSQCGYCHRLHEVAPVKMSKNLRKLFASLSREERMFIILCHLSNEAVLWTKYVVSPLDFF